MEVSHTELAMITSESLEQIAQMLSRYQEQHEIPKRSANVAGKNNMNMSIYKNDFWILNSGATYHMSCRKDWLTDLKSISFIVQLPNISYSDVSKSENFVFGNHKSLNNVLYLPDFKHNLISIIKISKDLSCSITFYPKFAIMQDL